MTDPTVSILAAGVPILVAVYWICLIFGGGLLLLSLFSGGDADTALDGDISLDGDVADGGLDTGHADSDHVDAGSLASWFSLRFLIYFLAAFGLIGVTLSHLSDFSQWAVVLSSVIGGLVVGQGVHQAFQIIRRNSGNSLAQPDDYINRLGRVTVAIAPGRTGEVAVQVRGTDRYVPAVSKHGDGKFSNGQTVGVVKYAAGIAEVISKEEFEFLSDSDKGGQS